MNQQLFEKGLKSFQQAAEADPKLAIARLNEGIAYLNLQKVDEAKAALEDALKQDPKSPNAWYGLACWPRIPATRRRRSMRSSASSRSIPTTPTPGIFWARPMCRPSSFRRPLKPSSTRCKINPLHASAEFGLSRAYQQSADADHAREHLKRFQYITQNKIGAPMSLAYGEQGQYSRAVESPQRC